MSRREFLEDSFKLALFAGSGLPRLMKPGESLGRFFGAGTHFGQHRAGIDEVLDLVKDAGIGWIRDEVYWSQVEKEKGVFKFPPDYDRYLRAAQARGIQVLLILDFGNPLYSVDEKSGPATDAERGAFARYCREVVKRYKPFGVRTYEIWNEPNASTFWRPRPNPEDYAKLLDAAYQACKDADPDAIVIGCSTSGTDLEFIGRVLEGGGRRALDGISFHPYCQPLAPEKKLLTDIAKLTRISAGKPLWITEMGYPTYGGAAGVDEETQANYAVRTFLLARTSPAVARVFWYDFQNDGEDRDEAEFNFGLVRLDRTPKPAYRACRTMASLVGDLRLADFRVEGNTYLLSFGEGAGKLNVIWRLGGAEPVAIPCPSGRYRLIDRDGESRIVEAKGHSLAVQASERPVYLTLLP